MYKIIKKEVLNPTVTKMIVEAPLVAKKAKAGQFIILRVHESGERIPLTIADYDRKRGNDYDYFSSCRKDDDAVKSVGRKRFDS